MSDAQLGSSMSNLDTSGSTVTLEISPRDTDSDLNQSHNSISSLTTVPLDDRTSDPNNFHVDTRDLYDSLCETDIDSSLESEFSLEELASEPPLELEITFEEQEMLVCLHIDNRNAGDTAVVTIHIHHTPVQEPEAT